MFEQPQIRPPFVRFEMRAIEDREKSIETGHYVARDVAYAVVTPQGSRDRIERVAEEWLDIITMQAKDGRIPSDWPAGFRRMYQDWLAGHEAPLDGTDIRAWPPISPAQAANCVAIGVRTVEDLAVSNEEAIQHLGMGARSLRDKAREWVKSAQGQGVEIEQLSALKTENDMLKEQVENLTTVVMALKAQMGEDKPRAGRPRKATADEE